jgi:hypothetical protein
MKLFLKVLLRDEPLNQMLFFAFNQSILKTGIFKSRFPFSSLSKIVILFIQSYYYLTVFYKPAIDKI